MIDVREAFGIVPIALPTPFPVGPVNVFLIKGDPPVLVDTGLRSDETYDALTKAIGDEGYALSDFKDIIVTHGHRDHMGLLGRILSETDAEAHAHPLVKQQGLAMNDLPEARKQFYVGILEEFGVPQDLQTQANSLYDQFRAFSEPFDVAHVVEDESKALDFTAYHVPGHSPSDTLFVDEERGISITGDHVLITTNPNPLLRRPEPGQPRAKSLVEYQHSLQRTRSLNLGVCLPGHGDPFDDHVAVVDRILERQAKRSAQILKLVAEGPATPYDISKRLFPKLPTQSIHLGLSIAVGHLEVLDEHGKVTQGHRDSILYFELSP